jgi:DNA polymerase I-like protein with 3'-5' exonuclease and polymerase domains
LLVELDLSGADWVCAAFCANEKNMLEVFNSGKSPHVLTGTRIFGVSEEVVLRESKLIGLKNDPDEIAELRKSIPELSRCPFLPRTMSIRQASKKANHGLTYRLGYKKYALVNEIEERESKMVVEGYRGRAYPGLQNKWYPWIDKTIRDTRIMTNCFGRKVYFSGALDDETFREATAFVPQSTVFDISRRAMQMLLEDDTPDFEPAEMLAQVHDSILNQYRSRDFRAMARFAIKLGLDYMSPTLRYNDMDFTLGVGLKCGKNWGNMRECKLTPDEGALALSLEDVYEETHH